ncbi:MAG: nitroreductase [Robiginitomaculum sp.]|nr:nitroreductase [Robiginitomaculum sp.]MDQ7077156.1 nitroreductase [Robiginitomaculum sp.]
MSLYPEAPAADAMLAASHPNAKVLAFLNVRRSFPAAALKEPGPNREEISQILRLAMRVPDHRRLSPWRVMVFDGSARARAGEVFAARYRELNPRASVEELDRERRRFCCAPLVIAVISSPDHDHKTPVWEQELSVGALCFNLLLVANAAGWAGSWLTGWMAFDRQIAKEFGLQDHERFAGFFHLGTAKDKVKERPRPVVEPLLSYWQGK